MPRRKQPDSPPRRAWNSGSISFVASRQQWRARTPRDATGRRYSSYHPTRPGAEAWLTGWIDQAQAAAAPFDAASPFWEYLRYWYRIASPRWTPNQKRKVRSQINVCRPITHHATRQLTTLHIEVFLASLSDRGLSALYVRNIGRLIGRALAWGVRRKILSENVAEDIELPSARRKPPQAYTAPEVRAITRGAQGERFEAAFLLFVHAGCRIGEVLPMPWRAIDAENNTVHVETAEQTAAGRQVSSPKYDSEGGVDVAPPIIRRLVELREAADTPWVLGKPAHLQPHDRKRKRQDGADERWCDTTVRRDWYALLDRLKVRRLPPHGGRHSFATGHMTAGTDLADIADLMRHKSPAITAAIYLSGNQKRRKAAAERLGHLFTTPEGEQHEQSG